MHDRLSCYYGGEPRGGEKEALIIEIAPLSLKVYPFDYLYSVPVIQYEIGNGSRLRFGKSAGPGISVGTRVLASPDSTPVPIPVSVQVHAFTAVRRRVPQSPENKSAF